MTSQSPLQESSNIYEEDKFRSAKQQLMSHTHLSGVRIPAEDSVIFSTTQQKLRVSLAPGYGQNSPGRKYQ